MTYKQLALYASALTLTQGCFTKEIQAISMRNFWIGTSVAGVAGSCAAGALYYYWEKQKTSDQKITAPLIGKTVAVGLLGGTVVSGLTALSLYSLTPYARLKRVKSALKAIAKQPLAHATHATDAALKNSIITTYLHNDYPLTTAAYELKNTEDTVQLLLDAMQQALHDAHDNQSLRNQCQQIISTLQTHIAHIRANTIHLRNAYANEMRSEKQAALQERVFSLDERKTSAAEKEADAHNKRADAETIKAYNQTWETIRNTFSSPHKA